MKLFNQMILAASSDESCPSPDDRIKIMKDWTCDEYADFMKIEKAREITNIVSRGVQILVFTWLLYFLLKNRFKRSTDGGRH